MARAERETLEIPEAIRAAVDARDRLFCRFCGRYEGARRALHHIAYGGDRQGMGGRRRHHLDNLLTVGWLFEADCHSIIHGDKGLWMPYALTAAVTPGVTMLQLRRWSAARPLRRAR